MIIHEMIYESAKLIGREDIVTSKYLFTILFMLLNPTQNLSTIHSQFH